MQLHEIKLEYKCCFLSLSLILDLDFYKYWFV